MYDIPYFSKDNVLKVESYSHQSISVSLSLLQICHIIKTNSHRWTKISVSDMICLPACLSLQVSYRVITDTTSHLVAKSSAKHYE